MKNAFRRLINAEMKKQSTELELPLLPVETVGRICGVFQEVVFDHIRDKLDRAISRHQRAASQSASPSRVRGLVVVGGVASNQKLRR